jgi:hypothetical protein
MRRPQLMLMMLRPLLPQRWTGPARHGIVQVEHACSPSSKVHSLAGNMVVQRHSAGESQTTVSRPQYTTSMALSVMLALTSPRRVCLQQQVSGAVC